MEDLLWRPALELARLVRERAVSPVELVTASLTRIERVDARLNSVVSVDADAAFAAARQAEQAVADGAPLPPFHGVPTAIKDLHCTRGLRTTFGTKSLAEFVPDFDEEHVARLRRAGFVFVGKTNVPEFGTVPFTESELLGPCRNPWRLEHTPGG
jgi:amidase